uniref:Uncharacterized protein n=1 Tax=Spironucleus salmonicida TaxID=348837 RepID=V6LNM7_9EUKA|eukprot:EST46200.1 Hypothetical protein SS50377_13795 [Spironucleus salmonicida]
MLHQSSFLNIQQTNCLITEIDDLQIEFAPIQSQHQIWRNNSSSKRTCYKLPLSLQCSNNIKQSIKSQLYLKKDKHPTLPPRQRIWREWQPSPGSLSNTLK